MGLYEDLSPSDVEYFVQTYYPLRRLAGILSEEFGAEDTPALDFGANSSPMWILIAGFLVFFMHAGFTMLEGGSVRHRNAVNIMYKNIGTMSLGAVMYFLFGFGFAYGEKNGGESSAPYIGSGFFGLRDSTEVERNSFFFQLVFAATAATIVSGAVAGRVALPAYFGVVAWLTAFVYPVVTHWVWATGGWISAFPNVGEDPIYFEDGGCGFIDYAGSGVVHLTGGVAAFWTALFLGPRLGRFDSDDDFSAHNLTLCTLGTFILWFGWYGFNCGSTLAWDAPNASRVAMNTTLSPSAAAITGMIVSRLLTGSYNLPNALNCVLAGLVSITAGCSTIPEYYTVLTGIIGGLIFMASSKLMKLIKVDDPVDAISVHGTAGIWGCIAVGIFADSDIIETAYSLECKGASGVQFQTQILGVAVIIGWVSALIAPLALILKITGKLRVSEEAETEGLDSSEHGGVVMFIPGDDKM